MMRAATSGSLAIANVFKHGSGGARNMVLKASNRAAVHGLKLPEVDIVDKEKVQMEIDRAKHEKEKLRKEIEETVDSQLKKVNAEILADSNPK